MRPKIDFLNFKPADDVREYIICVMDQLNRLAPSDADLVTRIFKTGKQEVLAEIRLCSSRLRCTCRGTAKSIHVAVDKALGEMENKIFDWKASMAPRI